MHRKVHRRYCCHILIGDGSSSWNSPSSLHTPTALDKAYDDHICDTITSRTDPTYSHRVHVTIVIPQVEDYSRTIGAGNSSYTDQASKAFI
ncbi:UNVERIFIED_CONTAM: hypothetical protein Sradi_3313000 [Sesamum radiatum]|uniref:Uncharacterized protein n=1 Tax=Sesamum radiatum TaxID=300843 RepID=A0AAW2R2F3_SESRA